MDNRFAQRIHEAASRIPRHYWAPVAGLVFALLIAVPTAPTSAQPAKDPLPAAKPVGEPLGEPIGEPLPALVRNQTTNAHFSADGKTVLMARHLIRQQDGKRATEARLFNAVTGKPVGPALSFRLPLSITVGPGAGVGLPVLVDLHDKTIVTAEPHGLPPKSDIQVWDATTGKPVWGPVTVDGVVSVVAFSPAGKTILTVNPEGHPEAPGSARLWDAANGKAIGDPLLAKFGEYQPRVVFSPDSKTLVTAPGRPRRGEIRFWDVATGKPRGDLLPHSGEAVFHVGFSPDGKTLLTLMVDREYTFRVWDAATSKPLGEPLGFPIGRSPVLANSPDARTVLTSTKKNTAQLWDVLTGKTLGEALPHDDMVYRAAFSPDGKVLLTVSGSNAAVDKKLSEVRLWDVATGKPFCCVPHKGVVVGAAFSPDGTVLLLASHQDARLWQVPKLRK